MSVPNENHLYSENIDMVCRLCLSYCEDNVLVFSNFGSSCKLQEKVFKQFNLWIKPDEQIPKAICKTCLTQVNVFYSFSLRVDAVQKKIQAVFLNHLTSNGDVHQDHFHVSENLLDVASSKNIQVPQINNVTSNNCFNYSSFPGDFDPIIPIELDLNFREPLSNVDVYRTPTLPDSTNDCCKVPQASTSTLKQASTIIEVEPDVDNYVDQSNDDSDVFASQAVQSSYSPFSSVDPSIENSVVGNGETQVTQAPFLQDIDSDGGSNEVEEISPKKHRLSHISEDNISLQSHDSDAFNVLEQRSPSVTPKSDSDEGELVQHPFRWSKKRPLTKTRLARLKKSKKIKEQLDSFFQYACNDCEDKPNFSNFLLLKNHCRDIHKKKACVVCCERKLTERKALIHHMLTQHLQPNEYNCHLCGKSVSTQHMLKLHTINHLPESERPYKCSKCGKGFCSIAYVRKHEKGHHFTDEPVGSYICDVCGKAFIYERKLFVHKRNLHAKVENPVMCHICAKTFKHQSALRSHLMTHNEGRTEECPYCHKFFKNVDTVRSHVKQEHRVTPAQCDLCDKTFRSKRKLVCHLKVFHTSEKPFECSICNKRFKLKSGLKTHLVQHTGEKPYKCPYCSRTFASSGNWSTHKKRMHNESKSVSSYAPVLPGK